MTKVFCLLIGWTMVHVSIFIALVIGCGSWTVMGWHPKVDLTTVACFGSLLGIIAAAWLIAGIQHGRQTYLAMRAISLTFFLISSVPIFIDLLTPNEASGESVLLIVEMALFFVPLLILLVRNSENGKDTINDSINDTTPPKIPHSNS